MDDNYQKRRLPSHPVNLIGWVAASVAILVTFSYAVSAEKSPELRPPPLTFVLEVAGTPIPVELDKAFEVNVNGKKVSMKLTAEPFRVFRAAGIHFKYPRDLAFSVETDSPVVTIWGLDGTDNVITIMKYPQGDKQSILAETVKEIVQLFGAVNVKQSDVELKLQARRLKSRLLLQVHDELVLETPARERDEVAELVQNEMSRVMELAVPLLVDVGSGLSWADAH